MNSHNCTRRISEPRDFECTDCRIMLCCCTAIYREEGRGLPRCEPCYKKITPLYGENIYIKCKACKKDILDSENMITHHTKNKQNKKIEKPTLDFIINKLKEIRKYGTGDWDHRAMNEAQSVATLEYIESFQMSNKCLRERIEILKEQIKYMPDGSGYQEAKESFENKIEK